MARVVAFGATSALASAFSRALLARGEAAFLLVGRDDDRLRIVADDLRVRGATHVEAVTLPAARSDPWDSVRNAVDRFAPVDIVLVAQGLLPEQQRLEAGNADLLAATIEANLESVMRASLLAAQVLETQRRGTLVIVGSIAGDRGRRSNYVYGSMKAAVAVFAEGLRLRIADAGVRVLLVKPGAFRSPMTSGLKPGLLWSEPTDVATAIVKAIERRRRTIYVPSVLRVASIVLRRLPDALLRRLEV